MKDEEKQQDSELVRVIADRTLVGALLVAGVVLAIVGDREHAGMLLAGALAALSPLGAKPTTLARAAPLVFGIGAGVALAGCGAVTSASVLPALRDAARVSCAVVERAHDACELAGFSEPRASCEGSGGD